MRYSIYRGEQIVLANFRPEGTVTERVMGEETASLSFTLSSYIDFHIGDRISIYGKDYFLSTEPIIVKKSTREFQYSLIFYSLKYKLADFQMFFYDNNNELTLPDFYIMGTADTCLDVVLANANRADSGWTKGIVDSTEVKNVNFSDCNLLEAISKIAEEFKLEYWIYSDKSIHFTERKPVSGYSFEYGKAKGLKNITRSVLEGGNLVTRLYVKGSDKNLPKNYRGGQKNLRIDVPCLEKNISIYGLKEHTEKFEEIYPKRVGTVTAIDENDPNRFTDADLDFDLNAYNEYGSTVLMNGVAVKVIFQTGQLAGYRLELIEAGGFNSATKTYYLNPNKDEKDLLIPSALMRPAVGDKYILEDLMMPEAYVLLAESELKTKGQEYLEQNSKDRFQYAAESDIILFKNLNINIQLGATVHFIDVDFALDDDIRITGLQKNIQNPYDVKFDLSEVTSVSSIVQSYYDQQEQQNTIINQIKYNAELARRNYLFGREFHEKVFDGEGYFDAENIKPLSIETKMLSLGSRLQQFGLPGVNFQIQNNNALSNTAGKIAHQTINPTGIREWTIPANTAIGITPAFNYIYIKCQKVGTNASFVVTEAQIKVEQDPDFYHFEVGYLSSVIDGYRKIKTTYGFAQLNPAELSIGKISDPTGNNYIELLQDKIDIKAKVEFTGDSPAFDQVNNSIQIGGRNLAINSTGLIDSNAYWLRDFNLSESLEVGQKYTITIWTKAPNQNILSYFRIGDQIGTLSDVKLVSPNKFQVTFTASRASSKIILFHEPNDSTCYQFEKLKLEKGTKGTDWTPATEDIQEQVDDAINQSQTANNILADIANDNKLTPQEKQQVKQQVDAIVAEKPQLIAQAQKYAVSTSNLQNNYDLLLVYINPLLVNLNTTSDIDGNVLRNKFNNYYSAKVLLLKTITDTVSSDLSGIRNNIQQLHDDLQQDISDVSSSVGELNSYVDGAFSDGIIDAAEAIAIEKYVNQINTEQSDLSQKYQIIYNDVNLTGSFKTELATAWGTSAASGTGYLGAHKKLIISITTAIADGKTTVTEKLDVDSKFSNYKDALSLLSAKFQNALTAIENERVNAIQVGGRNLALNSKEFIDSNARWLRDFVLSEPLKAGKEYAIKIWCKGVQNENAFFTIGDQGGFLVNLEKTYFSATNSEFVGKIIMPRDSNGNLVLLREPNDNSWYQFEKLKIEKGNKATDWNPAPEDVQENIDNAQNAANSALTILTDIGSDNKLTASEKQTTQNEWNRIKSEYSNNFTQASSLLLSVTAYQSAYNALNNYIAPLLMDLTSTSNINGDVFRNTFKNYYDQNIAIVTTIGNKLIANVQVGGRNLALKSKEFINSNNYFVKDFETSEILKQGHQYTVTVWTKNVNQNVAAYFSIGDQVGNFGNLIKISDTEFVGTFILPRDSAGKITLFREPDDVSWYQFEKFQIEKGNKSTDWTPANEDIDSAINAANQQSANAIAQAQNAMNTAALANQVTSFLNTTVNQNVVATGTLLVGDVNGANAMISGVTDQPNGESIRFAAGKPYGQKYLSPFQVLDNGMVRFVNPTTGQKTFELGFNKNTGKVVFDIYNESGVKVATIGSQGIMFTGYIPESYTKRKFRKLTTTSFTPSAINAELTETAFQKFEVGRGQTSGEILGQWIEYDVGLNSSILAYEYYEGRNFESADNSQYVGFYTTANKFGSKIDDGIYAKQQIIGAYYSPSEGSYNTSYATDAYLVEDGKIISSYSYQKILSIATIPVRGNQFPPEDYEQ